jgi:hypothetical protein
VTVLELPAGKVDVTFEFFTFEFFSRLECPNFNRTACQRAKKTVDNASNTGDSEPKGGCYVAPPVD